MHDYKQWKINSLFQPSNCVLYLTNSSCLSGTEETKRTEGKNAAERPVLVQMNLLWYQAMHKVESIVCLQDFLAHSLAKFWHIRS